jgi:glutamate carboxypeptidase
MSVDVMLDDLGELVTCESFSADYAALARSAQVVAAQGRRLLDAAPELLVIDGVPHLRWSFGKPTVLLLGHHDTVWPIGSLATHPWSVTDGVARGPGVFDMKAGLVQIFHALASLPSLDGVCVLITGDEEVGSLTSRGLIEETARACAATFVLEASADGGALKTARKGTSSYEVVVHGKAAHSGLEPHKGINAGVEVARQILIINDLAERVNQAEDNGYATTVTPTVMSAGTSSNTVPARASVIVDVRAPSVAAQQKVDDLIRGLTPVAAGARLEVTGGPNRAPFEAASSADLFVLAQRIGGRLGIELTGAAVGGASDGNFTAGVGCPTLDGLGAVGGGAHADHEHTIVADLPVRTRLLAELVSELTTGVTG